MTTPQATGAVLDDPGRAWFEAVPAFADLGVHAFTTTRDAGSFSTVGDEPVGRVMGRWRRLQEELAPHGPRLATAAQVHGDQVVVHEGGWTGWLRAPAADGHFAAERGTALAVTVADCVPVFLAHPSGAIALLHSGWRGTATRIVERAVALFAARGLAPADLRLHAGPAICGDCYEVSPEVYHALTGEPTAGHRTVDLRALIVRHAERAGVRALEVSARCTRCDNDRFFSHRAGDPGRQLAVMVATA